MVVKGDRLSLFVTYVEKGCCAGQCQIWAQSDMENYGRLERLMSAQRACKTAPNVPDFGSICPGDIVLARYEDDDDWYRAQVLEILTGRLYVCFIDFGNKETVGMNRVVVASGEFFSIPPLADLYVIAGLTPRNGVTWTSSEQEVIHHNLLNAEFKAEIVAVGTIGFPSSIKLLNADFLPPLISVPPLCLPVIDSSTEFDASKVYTVYLTHCESMLDFWIQDASIQDTLDRFHAAIFDAVQGGKAATLDDVHRRPGVVCIARYRGSDQFYRAVLKEVNWHGKCAVTYIDYGDSANVEASDLWPMESKFTELPLQAVRCSVTGLSVDLNTGSFRKLLATGLPITVRVRAVVAQRHLIEIISDVKATRYPSANERPVAAANTAQLSSVPAVADLCQYIPLTLPDAVWHDVCISHVEQDGSFYCQLLTNAPVLNEMMLSLNKRQFPVISTAITNGMAAVIRDPSENSLFRAEVKSLTSGCVKVLLVDFGGHFECRTTELCSAAFTDFPSQAFHCHLEGAEERPPATVAALLRQFESKIPLLLAVRHKAMATYFVDLVDTRYGKSLRIVDHLLRATSQAVPASLECKLNVLESAYVTAIVGDGEFYAQLSDVDVDKLDQFSAKLNQFYSANTVATLTHPQPGDFCCCQYSSDEQFYRATIIREFAAKYQVLFLDYGNEEFKELCELHVLMPQFCNFVRQAVHCKLVPGSLGSMASRNVLEDHLLNQSVQLLLVAKLAENSYSVRLADTQENMSLLRELTRPLNVNTGASVGPGIGLSPTSKPVVSPHDVHSDKRMLMGRERGQSSSSVEDRMPNSAPFAANAYSPKDGGIGHQSSLQRNLSCSSTGSSAGAVVDTELLATKACMSFVDEKVAVREWLSCVVCHVDDPQNFYCQLEGDQNVELLEGLMSRIEKYVSSLPPGIGVLRTATLGQPVVAKYSADGSWYRARVTGVMKASRKLEVHFVDFGNREIVPTADVRDMPNNILSLLPAQAVPCGLYGIDAISFVSWSTEEIENFRQIVQDERVKVYFTGDVCPEGRHLVHLLNGQENINRNFLRSCKRLSSTYSSPVNSDGSRGAGDPQHTNSSSTRGRSDTASYTMPVCDVKIEQFEVQEFKPGTVLECYVAYVSSPSQFYCQLKETADKLEDLMSQLNSHGNNGLIGETIDARSLVPGTPCAALYTDDGRWYRAVILPQAKNRAQTGQVCVEYVDYGNSDVVSIECVRALKAGAMKLPLQALHCALDSIKPTVSSAGRHTLWSEEACNAFEQLFNDSSFEVKIVSYNREAHNYVVNIGSVSNKFVSQGFAVSSGASAGMQHKDLVKATQLQQRPLLNQRQSSPTEAEVVELADRLESTRVMKPNVSVNVGISHVVSPLEFYCQLDESAGQLEELMEKIDNDYKHVADSQLNLSRPRVGQPCCARYSEDGAWYRATIMETERQQLRIFFVDYGNSELLSSSEVKSLKRVYASLPVQAIKCQLRDIETRQLEKAKMELEQLTTDQTLSMTVLSYSQDCYTVDLFNTNTKQDLRQVLIDKKVVTDASIDGKNFSEITVEFGREHVIVPSWINSPSDFYCQLAANSQVIEKLSQGLYETYMSLKLNELSLKPNAKASGGQPCVAFYDADGSWYRSRLLDFDPIKNDTTVMYIDYGNIEHVKVSRVKTIKAKFLLEPPAQAIHCCLSGMEFESKSTPELNALFTKLLSSGNVKCNFVSVQDNKYIVDIRDSNGERILEKLSQKVAKPTHIDAPADAQSGKTYKPFRQFSRNDVIKVEIVYIAGDSKTIYCHIVGQTDTLEQLMEPLRCFCETSSAPVHMNQLYVGKCCAARYSEDEVWYRAVIVSTSSSGIMVQFVDYGNTETCQLEDIRLLDGEFIDIPMQCLMCRLADDVDAEKMSGILLDKQLLATIADVQENVHVVQLTMLDGKQIPGLPVQEAKPNLIQDELNTALVKPESMRKLTVPQSGSKHLVYVSAAVSPTDFHVQLVSATDELTALSEQLLAEYGDLSETDKQLPLSITAGSLCCARYSDGAWYRAVIDEIEQMDNASVYRVTFIDYGNTDEVSYKDLKVLTESWSSVGHMAFHCSLAGVQEPAAGWADDVKQAFIDKTESGEKEFSCKFIVHQQKLHVVKLFDGEFDVGIEFNADYSKLQPAACGTKLLPDADVPTTMKVCVSHVESPSEFYIQPVDCEVQLTEFSEQLTAEYDVLSHTQKLSDVTVGMLCCARYSADDAWYRAIITDIDNNTDTVTVLFVDYGNKDIVSCSGNGICHILDRYANQPTFAWKCTLSNVETPTGGWTNEDVQKFRDVVMSEESPVLMCSVVSQHDDKTLVVDMKQGDIDIGMLFVTKEHNVDVSDSIDTQSFSNPVSIVWANSLVSFYIQKAICQPVFEKLSLDLESIVESAASATSCDVGQMYACQFSEDELWYRAVILAVNNNGTVSVQFVDFGNQVDSVAVENLKVLPDEMKQVEQLAVHCKLSSLPQRSHDIFESKESGQMLMDLYLEKTLDAVFKDNSSDGTAAGCHSVELSLDGVNILSNLLKSLNIPVEEETNEMNTPVTTAHSSTLPTAMLPSGKYRVMVSHVLSSHEVYLQLSKDAADLEEMFDRLDEIYNSALADENIEDLRRFISTGQLTIGLLVCVHCRLSDSESLDGWYRAEVLSVEDESVRVNVLMVDYGITRVVTVGSIYSLEDAELISRRPLAFLCNLFGVNSCAEDEAKKIDELKLLTYNKVLTADLRFVADCSKPDVILYDKVSNINSVVGQQPVEYEIKQQQTSKDYVVVQVEPRVVEVGHRYEVYVSDINSVSHFSCLLTSDEHPRNLLVSNMTTFYNANVPDDEMVREVDRPVCVNDFQPGSFYAVRCMVDSECRWYRGQFIKLNQKADDIKVEIKLIDIGRIELAALDDIRMLSPKFASHNAFSFSCSLYDWCSSDNSCVELFKQIVDGRKLLADVVSFQSNTASYEIKLLDMGFSVADKLSTNGVTSFNVYVTVSISPSQFYCHIDNKQSTIELPLLMDQIADLCGSEDDAVPSHSLLLSADTLCAAKFTDDVWYRARILLMDENNKTANVSFIDYGNTATVSQSDLRPLPADLLSLPPQAVSCCLSSVCPVLTTEWDESSCNRFIELVTCRPDDARSFELQPCSVQRDVEQGHIIEVCGQLFDGGVDIADKLVSEGYAQFYRPAVQENHQPVCRKSHLSESEGERCNVFVRPLNTEQLDFIDRVEHDANADEHLVEEADDVKQTAGNAVENEFSEQKQVDEPAVEDIFVSPSDVDLEAEFLEASEVLHESFVDVMETKRDSFGNLTDGAHVITSDASAFRQVFLSENEAMDVHVLSVDKTNGLVVCQPLETKDELDKMHQHLQAVYSNDEETTVLDDVEPGQPCAVLSTLNGNEAHWYRGQIISRTSDAVEDLAVNACVPIKVYLVDVGQTAYATSLHIKLLQQQFFVLPAQAISVTVSVNSIVGIENLDGSIRSFKATVQELPPKKPAVVSLVRSDNEQESEDSHLKVEQRLVDVSTMDDSQPVEETDTVDPHIEESQPDEEEFVGLETLSPDSTAYETVMDEILETPRDDTAVLETKPDEEESHLEEDGLVISGTQPSDSSTLETVPEALESQPLESETLETVPDEVSHPDGVELVVLQTQPLDFAVAETISDDKSNEQDVHGNKFETVEEAEAQIGEQRREDEIKTCETVLNDEREVKVVQQPAEYESEMVKAKSEVDTQSSEIPDELMCNNADPCSMQPEFDTDGAEVHLEDEPQLVTTSVENHVQLVEDVKDSSNVMTAAADEGPDSRIEGESELMQDGVAEKLTLADGVDDPFSVGTDGSEDVDQQHMASQPEVSDDGLKEYDDSLHGKESADTNNSEAVAQQESHPTVSQAVTSTNTECCDGDVKLDAVNVPVDVDELSGNS